MKKVISAVILLCTITLWYSCSKDTASNCTTTACATGKTTYTQAKAVIDANCISCHNGTQSPNLNSYCNLKTNISKVLCTINQSGCTLMPPSGALSASDIAIVQKWNTDGMCEN